MEKNKLNQSAGNNSTQVQAGTINNYNITNTTGIDEDKARLICKEEYAIAKQNWTIEANKIAEERVLKLENKLMPKMIQYDNSLKTFSDPSFQVTLRKAQISAASSDKEDDLDMLSELLLHRAENNSNREKKLGITKAIEIVDQIPDSSLIGLSIFYAISKYIPDSHKINNGLGILDELYKIIINNTELPTGTRWLDNLDILSAIRISSSGTSSFKKLNDYIPFLLSKYIQTGIQIDSVEYKDLVIKLYKAGFSVENNSILPKELLNTLKFENISFEHLLKKADISIFKENPLRKGYLINNFPDYTIHHLSSETSFKGEKYSKIYNEEQKAILQEIINLSNRDDSNIESLRLEFMKIWDELYNLRKVHIWWDQLPLYFEITPIGEAIANAYIRTRYPTIPSLY